MTVTEPAPFEIGLLRHFPTLWNQEGRLQGRTDIPLAPASRAALATLALPPRWRGLPVICSPLGRAVETAEALTAGAPIRLDDRLVEMHMGDWEGRIGADLLADPDCAYRPVEDWGWDFQPPGGETPVQVLLNINSFLLGARTVDPEITCQVIFTGEWSLAVKEAEATNALADQGVDVVTCHVDGPKVVMETGAARGMYLCGYHVDQSALAPDKYLTGAEWNWGKVYTEMIETQLSGGTIPNFVRGGLAEGFIKMSPLGPAVTDAARKQFETTRADVLLGDYAVIRGPLKDNQGNVIATEGQSFVESDVELESMDYLVDGVLGSTS